MIEVWPREYAEMLLHLVPVALIVAKFWGRDEPKR